jgi:Apea-like HEPN
MSTKKWISRLIIDSGVPLESGSFEFEGCMIETIDVPSSFSEYFPNKFENISGLKMVTIIVEMSEDLDIFEVYLKTLEVLDKLLNRISLLGYCNSNLLMHVSTTDFRCEIDGNFESLVTDQIVPKNYKLSFPLDVIQKIEPIPYDLEVSLSFFRRALTTNSLEEKILMLSTCLERIAGSEATDTVKKIVCDNCKCNFIPDILVCEKCNKERKNDTGQKATKRYLKQILTKQLELMPRKYLNKDEIKPVNRIINDFDEARNKVAHGGGERDLEFFVSMEESIAHVQDAIATLLAQRLGCDFVNANFSWVKQPLMRMSGRKIGLGDYLFNPIRSNYSIINLVIDQAPDDSKGKLTLDFGKYFVNPFEKFPDLAEFYLPRE